MNKIARVISLIPAQADKDTRYRLGKFEKWSRDLLKPDLAGYRDYLLGTGKAASTISAHLSTIRARYKLLVLDRDSLYILAARATNGDGDSLSILERKAFVDELVTRIENAVNPILSKVETVTKQDVEDSTFIRLTQEQANTLMAKPGYDTLIRLRDTCIIALMLCTGIREQELCDATTDDLRQELGGALSLRILKGKGKKQRLIPYGSLDWILVLIDKWLDKAGITTGYVFRPFYKGESLRSDKMNTRDIQRVLAKYPIVIKGETVTVKPHDLRRSYARILYDSGMDTIAIQQNLGHSNLKTTLGYIGQLDAGKRKPKDVYQFDISKVTNGK